MTDRNVTVVTGTRAEYGLLKSPMCAIRDHPQLSLSVVATGMHLSPRYGNTVEEIRNDGFDVDREVESLLDSDSGRGMAKTLGITLSGVTDAVASLEPDVVIVLGDRGEALAGAVAAAHMNVPVAHIHGGDALNGAVIDDSIRHAITKFAHLHFPSSELSAERVSKLGEPEWRIDIVGAPGLDDVLTSEYETPDKVLRKHGIPTDSPIALVVQHPVTSQADHAGEQMAMTLDAVTSVDVEPVVIYPNADAGGRQMIDEIEARTDSLYTFKNLPRKEYLALLDASSVMVGNSSSGIIEAPSFGLPVVDVGPRQDGRQRADNTISVPHDADAISDAIRRCLEDDEVRRRADQCVNPYDHGGAGDRIADRLASVTIDDRLLQKKLSF